MSLSLLKALGQTASWQKWMREAKVVIESQTRKNPQFPSENSILQHVTGGTQEHWSLRRRFPNSCPVLHVLNLPPHPHKYHIEDKASNIFGRCPVVIHATQMHLAYIGGKDTFIMSSIKSTDILYTSMTFHLEVQSGHVLKGQKYAQVAIICQEFELSIYLNNFRS